MAKKLLWLALLPSLTTCVFVSKKTPQKTRLREVKERVVPSLKKDLKDKGLLFGSPVFIRLFKEEKTLELWLENNEADPTFRLFRTYEICNFSGGLGPKIQTGDRQSPEGFYAVRSSQMNPKSRFHLAFNLGFPNEYDRQHDRTGSFLMVHGNCVSIGCYAIGDENIEELYTIADAALSAGQGAFDVHIFPFRMTEANMERHANSQWMGFWRNLKEGYDAFELGKRPPKVAVKDNRYVFFARRKKASPD